MTDGPGSSAGDVVGGRYRLEAELGRGGMAVVWRATDLKLDRTVAVKVFRREVAEAVDPQRTARETHLLAGMRHPAVVGALDASSGDADVTYLVMELVEGDDLKTLLRAGALDPDLTRRVVADVADALALLHSRGVVHRDVKPANILVVREPERRATGITAKLTDFGIAQAVDGTRITSSDMILGTAAYLSPEQVRGEPVGPASDVYAAGLVLAECLTGVRAFPGPPHESAVARLSSSPPVPSGASAELAALFTAMTAMDPADRPAAAAVAATLRDLAGSMTEPEEAETARVPRIAPSLLPAAPVAAAGAVDDDDGRARTGRRRPLLVPAIAAAVIAVLGGTGVLLSSPLLFGDGLLPRHVAAPPASGVAVPPGDAVSAGTEGPAPTTPPPSSAPPRVTRSTGAPVAAQAADSSPSEPSSDPPVASPSPSSPAPSPSASPTASSPAPSATPTATPTPTPTPTPTATSTPTGTPAPPATTSPAPTGTPAPKAPGAATG